MGQESNALSSRDYESHVLLLNYKPELTINITIYLKVLQDDKIKKSPPPHEQKRRGLDTRDMSKISCKFLKYFLVVNSHLMYSIFNFIMYMGHIIIFKG